MKTLYLHVVYLLLEGLVREKLNINHDESSRKGNWLDLVSAYICSRFVQGIEVPMAGVLRLPLYSHLVYSPGPFLSVLWMAVFCLLWKPGLTNLSTVDPCALQCVSNSFRTPSCVPAAVLYNSAGALPQARFVRSLGSG